MTDQPAAPQPDRIPLRLPPAAFADPADGFLPFPLAHPVTVDGRVFKLVGIRRFTVAQVRAVVENFRANLAADPGAVMDLPLFVDEAGEDLPPAVLDVITDDEMQDLDRAAAGFLPRRFRIEATAPEQAAGTSTSPGGESIAPSS